MNKKQIIGIVIFIVLIALIVGIKELRDRGILGFNGSSKTNTVYVATGGGKEGFIQEIDFDDEWTRKIEIGKPFYLKKYMWYREE